MQEQGKRVFRLVTKMNTFHVKNMTKYINPGKIIFVYSYNSERKQLNLKLLNFFLYIYVCTYISLQKHSKQQDLKTGPRCRTSSNLLCLSGCVTSM